MKKIHVLLEVLLVVISMNVHAQNSCYLGGKVVNLFPDNSSLRFVQTSNASCMEALKMNLAKGNKEDQIIQLFPNNRCIIKTTSLINHKSSGFIDYVSEIYYNEQNLKYIILPRLGIKLKPECRIDEITNKYGDVLTLDKSDYGIYKFDCGLRTAEQVMDLSNNINEMDEIEWCEPMVIGEAFPLNNYYSDQYYLKNTGQNGGTSGIDINVERAWDIVTVDTSLIVAVLDDGVERNHEDLTGSVIDGMTIDYPLGKGNPINEFSNYGYYDNNGYYHVVSDTKSHGTACAGIIAAHNNALGIRGVVSGVKILPINISPYPYPVYLLPYPTVWYEKVAGAIRWAYNEKNAAIISCSWGFSDNSLITSAINDAITYGRNGKGTVVVCASGNDYDNMNVKYPAKLSGTIAVGAVDNTGSIWNYSCRGSELDLVAPSGDVNMNGDVVTTDRSGNLGYNTNLSTSDLTDKNYTQTFGGTSAACPQVAGVAALMLSLRPDLTEEQVRTTLQNTARNLGPAGFDTTYGYGLVDAYAAVSAVDIGYNIVGKTVLCDTATYSVTDIPAGYTISWSVDNNNFSLTPNSNQCLVTYTGIPQYEIANLTASLMWNGYTVKSVTKRIVMHGTDMYLEGIQSGIYDENGNMPAVGATFTIPANQGDRSMTYRKILMNRDSIPLDTIPVIIDDPFQPIIPDNPTYGITEIYGGADIHIVGDRLDGMTISFSGGEPEYLSSDGGTMISFRMQEVSRITSKLGYYYVVLHATSDGGCHDFDLYFKVIPVAGDAIGDHEISLYFTDSSVRVDFDAMEWEDLNNGMLQPIPWYLRIFRMSTGAQMHYSVNTTDSKTVNTSSWPADVYIVRVNSNGNNYTKKFLKQ